MSVLRLTDEQYQAAQKRARKPPQTDTGRAFPASGVSAPSKYRNRATGGYASVKEARRAGVLKLAEKAGEIRNLREQVKFVLIPAQRDAEGKLLERECKFIADFVYQESAGLENGTLWTTIVEDVKSPATRTAVYRLKKKLLLLTCGIAIRET